MLVKYPERRLWGTPLQVRMVEGPQCHRVAHTHRKVLQGHAFKATSPNGRFTQGERPKSTLGLAQIVSPGAVQYFCLHLRQFLSSARNTPLVAGGTVT